MIQQILSFVAVVKAHSYSAAASETGHSKALLSRHVTQLEAYINQTLLYRTTRTLSLTEAGEQFYRQALLVEESYQNAMSSIQTEVSGKLRITSSISFGSEILPPIIASFTKRHPKVKVALSLSSLPEDLVEQRYDMSIRVAHALPDSNLRVKPLSSLEMILCAAPSYIENHSAPTIINDLIEHQCITSVNRHKELQTATWSFIQKKKTIKQKIIPHIEIDSIRAQIELVKLGRGIGRFPSMFVNSLIENGTLIPLLPKENLLPLRVFAMYPNAQFVPKKTRCFLGFMTTSALQVK